MLTRSAHASSKKHFIDRTDKGETTLEATVGGQTVSTTIDPVVADDVKALCVVTHVDHVNMRDGKATAAAAAV